MVFDYIIIGAGSSGCVVATRIADAKPQSAVALIEAGPQDNSLQIRVPILAGKIYSSKNPWNWSYTTVPQAGLNGRCGVQPRGRGLGGSSSINAMIYIRGHHEDYNEWEKLGCPGWGWNDVLPYFKRAENNERGKNAWHNTGGPLNVVDILCKNKFDTLFIEAAQNQGHPFNPDFNGENQEGVGYFQFTQKNGERCSAAKAYLHSKARKNLTVFTDTHVLKILFKDKRACGIEIERGDKIEPIYATNEIVISAGVFGTPHLLMNSGIGPADHLSQFNIPILYHAPEVGQNLQDHITYEMIRKINSPDLFGFTPAILPKLIRGIYEFICYRKGILTSVQCEVGAFFKTDPTLDRPDIQLHLGLGISSNHLHTVGFERGFTLKASLLRPKSRGTVLIASNNPKDAPLIDPYFFSESEDLDRMIKGAKLSYQILNTPPLSNLKSKDPDSAGESNDDAWRELIRHHSDTLYHPVGTCRMGSDASAVVDPQLRVNGVENLRIIDASIMPKIIGGNTNAAAIMIGEKGADMIIQEVFKWN